MEDLMEKLFKRLPKKYHDRVDMLEAEDGLIDDCKYMLYLLNHGLLLFEDVFRLQLLLL